MTKRYPSSGELGGTSARTPMSMPMAIHILGINRTRDGDLREMVKALGFFPWLNTQEDKLRLEAAQFVLRRWKLYQAACNRARDRRTTR
jgi:hypothetical protein